MDAIFSFEILLQIFSHIQLKSIIKARCTCTLWRQLVPVANLLPARRRLYAIYLEALDSEPFITNRRHVLENLREFDRTDCIAALRYQITHVPEDFELWIMEWPAKAAFDCFWPGLPHEWDHERDWGHRRRGWNLLANFPLQLFCMNFRTMVRSEDGEFKALSTTLPGLPIWASDNNQPSLWLILGTPESHDFAGRVIYVYTSAAEFDDFYDLDLEDNIIHKHPSAKLPFLDWLQLALKRYDRALPDKRYWRASFDDSTQSWIPDGDDLPIFASEYPYHDRGGGLARLRPWSEPVNDQANKQTVLPNECNP